MPIDLAGISGYNDNKLERKWGEMCNLSQGIKDVENVKIIMNMYKIGYTPEQIAEVVEKSVAEVEAVIKKREPALA